MRKLHKSILSPCVVDGKMILKIVQPVSEVTIDDLISLESLKSLNIQRFIIRRSGRVTNAEVRDLEGKHRRFARP